MSYFAVENFFIFFLNYRPFCFKIILANHKSLFKKRLMKKAILVAIVIISSQFICKSSFADTVSYLFASGNSTLVQYAFSKTDPTTAYIDGTFALNIDTVAGDAWFDQVDATLSQTISYWDYDVSDYAFTQDFDTQFCLSQLVSTSVSETEINFVLERNLPTFPGADVHLDLFFSGNSIQLDGWFGTPVYDGAWYDLNAVAVPEPSTLLLFGLGAIALQKRRT